MKTSTLVDANILIDVWGPPGDRTVWSASALDRCRSEGALILNAVIWSEIAPLAASEPSLEEAAATLRFNREAIPWSAAFTAGLTHARYRRAGGMRDRTLPDFLIGAHASVTGYRLLTRDPGRYRTYFPSLDIIAPDTHP